MPGGSLDPALAGVDGVRPDRHDEIVQWLIDESGSTQIEAEMEWSFTKAEMIEASSYSSAPLRFFDETG